MEPAEHLPCHAMQALHLTKEVVAQTEEPAAWLRVAAWLHIRLQQLPEASEDLRRYGSHRHG